MYGRRSGRKHLRAVFIELNRRGPWTTEEKRHHVRRIRHAVWTTGANGFDLLPQYKVKKPPKPQVDLSNKSSYEIVRESAARRAVEHEARISLLRFSW